MTTVAKSLNVPVKLLIPRPRGARDDPNVTPVAMLGLGDVVLPGIMISLALRFDLYLFYLHKQTRRLSLKPTVSEDEGQDGSVDRPLEVVKAPYQPATGRWGERSWTGRAKSGARTEGGDFPKLYFTASLVGYILGLVVTFGVLAFSGHAQPALLYLVPGVLSALWGLAAVRGEFKEMWEYVDVADEEEEDNQADQTPKKSSSLTRLRRLGSLSKKGKSEMNSDRSADGAKERHSRPQSSGGVKPTSTSGRGGNNPSGGRNKDELLSITVSRRAHRRSSSRSRPGSSAGAGGRSTSIVQDIREALDGDLHLRTASPHSLQPRQQQNASGAMAQASPAEKRPRLE